MATFKQQTKDQESASDCVDTVCQPCSVAGRSSISNMFCVDCQEYLCTNCTAYHRTLKITRSHTLVTLDDMSKNPSVKIDKCSKKCTIHKGKTVKYFCSTHYVFGCSVCANTDHKSCSDVNYIPTIAEELESNSEFKYFHEYLTSLDTAATQLTSDIENTLVQLKAEPKQIQEAIQLVKDDVIAKLDDLGKKLVRQAESVKREQSKKIQALLQTIKATKLSVQELKNETDSLINQRHKCDTYVLMKTHISELQSLRNKIEEAIKTPVKHTVFRPKTLQVANFGDLDMQEAQVGSNINLPNDDSGPKESIQAQSGPGMASTKSRQTLDGPTTRRGLRVGSRVRAVYSLQPEKLMKYGIRSQVFHLIDNVRITPNGMETLLKETCSITVYEIHHFTYESNYGYDEIFNTGYLLTKIHVWMCI